MRKHISNDLRGATVAAHQSGKGYKDISKLFGVHHSRVRKIIRTEIPQKFQEQHLRLYRHQL